MSVRTLLAILVATFAAASFSASRPEPGNVIFIHPDGVGVSAWGALRMLTAGPDGMLHWDRLERMGVYRGHMLDRLAATSNGGGTAHAYGVRPTGAAFGIDGGRQLVAASGKPMPLGREALEAGLAVGIVSSAGVVDAGTGVFLASTKSRREYTEIASQMLAAKPEVMLGGGESYFLPEGVQGRHGPGIRTDKRNLIDEAKAAGYTVVFDAKELRGALALRPKRLLGLFAEEDTFNDETEETLAGEGKPLYVEGAPTFDAMVGAALQVLGASGKRFFLVAEEEGTDNFAGDNNASGVLEALGRADRALGIAVDYAKSNPRTLVLTASDSDCGGLEVIGDTDFEAGKPLPARDEENGSPIDGSSGTGTPPFLSAPDAQGKRLPFGIAWAASGDLSGGILARAHGYRAELLPTVVHNTTIYKVMYEVLFGVAPWAEAPQAEGR